MNKKPKIFISYSHEDEEWKKLFKTSLQARFKDEFEVWHDRNIKLGEEWFDEIITSVHDTKIAILLITDDFLTSNFIKTEEIPRFRKLAKEKNLKLVPVIVSSCAWEEYSWLSSIQGYPKDNKPLDTFRRDYNQPIAKCGNIKEQITELTKRIKDEYEAIADQNEQSKEILFDNLIDFLQLSSIKVEKLKEISKLYIENEINQRAINEKTTLKDIIDYLDNLLINDKAPIYCIFNHIYKELDTTNQEIKEWIDAGYNEDDCKNMASKAKDVIEQKKIFFEQNEELTENRIILDFEQVDNTKKFNVYIRYFIDGKFTSNNEPLFQNIDIYDKEFQKELVEYLYDNVDLSYKYLNILLPKPILLMDIKQWHVTTRKRLTKKFIVNIHLRERAILKEKKAYIDMWENKSQQHYELINNALKPMSSEDDEATKDTKEAGLIYLYQPDKDIFYDDMRFSLISVRNSDNEKDDEYQKIWQEPNGMTLLDFKKYIDHDDNKYISLIWDDPKIPLKAGGIDEQARLEDF